MVDHEILLNYNNHLLAKVLYDPSPRVIEQEGAAGATSIGVLLLGCTCDCTC